MVVQIPVWWKIVLEWRGWWRWAVEGNVRYTSKVGVTEYKTLR